MRVVVLTGAGISAESGVRTFRDNNGLWHDHRVEDVATYDAWLRNPRLVLEFYNDRRRQLKEVEPNAGHYALVELEQCADVYIITQNVDDLHERAGSKHVLHLHGELRKVRSTRYPELIYEWFNDLHLGDTCARGAQLRPHIVWFGEEVPLITDAARLVESADRILVVGSSMQVYPAAGLVSVARPDVPVWYVDPYPSINYELQTRTNLTVIAKKAGEALPELVQLWLSEAKG